MPIKTLVSEEKELVQGELAPHKSHLTGELPMTSKPVKVKNPTQGFQLQIPPAVYG